MVNHILPYNANITLLNAITNHLPSKGAYCFLDAKIMGNISKGEGVCVPD